MENAAVDREELMVARGRERSESMIAKSEARGLAAETPAGQELTRRVIGPLSEGIRAFVEKALSGGAGRRSLAARMLQHVDPDVAALITIRVSLGTAVNRCVLKTAALNIANALEAELLADAFQAANAKLFKAVVRKAQKRGLTGERIAKAVELANRHFGVAAIQDPEIWTPNEKINLGTKLVELMIEHTKMIKTPLVRRGRKALVHEMQFESGILEWYNEFNAADAVTRPMWLPLTQKPRPWADVVGGAYSDRLHPRRLLTKPFAGQMEKLRGQDLTAVYTAVNGLQETPWRINQRVLAVLQEAWEKGLPLPAIPSRDDVPLPERPPEVEAAERGSPLRKEWRAKMRNIHDENAKRRAVRFEFARTLKYAAEVADEPAIYFPHILDFRGRCYAASTGINPQGADETRALLEFAEGKPLGERGLFWLGVHGANVFGNDKVSLEERYNWALAQGSRAMAVAADPLGDQWWTEADKPWSFLAWCFEWAAMMALDDRTYNGTRRFVSHLPIALDGSCNGIQHFSAMLRDEVGGAAVNLVPHDKPRDIYQDVADRVTEYLSDIAGKFDHPEHHYAYHWYRFGIDRKITKRAVMVLPYGGTFGSCLEYVSEATNERFKAGEENPFGDDLKKAQGWLAARVWEAIGQTVIAARAAMQWLQKCARVASAAGVDLEWTLPTGFRVVQAYRKKSSRRVMTHYCGSVVKFKSVEDTDEIDAAKQASAIAPNFVHGLDAAALMYTINWMRVKGVSSFAMIHDSYGTHAADTDLLAETLRDVFVAMYEENDVLQQFRDQLVMRLPPEAALQIPPPPQKGKLDLSAVRASPYFFA